MGCGDMRIKNFLKRRLSDSRLGYGAASFLIGLSNVLFNMMDFFNDVPLDNTDTLVRVVMIILGGVIMLFATLSLVGYYWRKHQSRTESAMSSKFNPYLRTEMEAFVELCKGLEMALGGNAAKTIAKARKKFESLEFS